LEIIRITQFLKTAQRNTEEEIKEDNETFNDNNYSDDSDIKKNNNDNELRMKKKIFY